MELEETGNIKSQYVNVYDSDTELAEKITQILNIYGKDPNFKDKPSFKIGDIITVGMDIALLNVDRNSKIIRTNHRNIQNQINHFINT